MIDISKNPDYFDFFQFFLKYCDWSDDYQCQIVSLEYSIIDLRFFSQVVLSGTVVLIYFCRNTELSENVYCMTCISHALGTLSSKSINIRNNQYLHNLQYTL